LHVDALNMTLFEVIVVVLDLGRLVVERVMLHGVV